MRAMQTDAPARATARPKTGSDRLAAWATWPAAIKTAIYVLGMTPAACAFYWAVTDQLGADPMKTLERSLGLVSLRFLVIGLAITPLRALTGLNLVRYRRAIGLVAFYNALLHVAVYVWLDQNLDAAAIFKDLTKRPYIMAGMLAFTILVPLAATSSATAIKRLGGAAWQKLHRWVYLAAAAACIHFLLVVKVWPPEPLFYTAMTAALLLWRVFDRRNKSAARAARGR